MSNHINPDSAFAFAYSVFYQTHPTHLLGARPQVYRIEITASPRGSKGRMTKAIALTPAHPKWPQFLAGFLRQYAGCKIHSFSMARVRPAAPVVRNG